MDFVIQVTKDAVAVHNRFPTENQPRMLERVPVMTRSRTWEIDVAGDLAADPEAFDIAQFAAAIVHAALTN